MRGIEASKEARPLSHGPSLQNPRPATDTKKQISQRVALAPHWEHIDHQRRRLRYVTAHPRRCAMSQGRRVKESVIRREITVR